MRHKATRWAAMFWLLGGTLAAAALAARARADQPGQADADLFEREIRPLLVQHCHKCHGDQAEPKGGLALTSREALLAGGEGGAVVEPGQPRRSRLIAAVHYRDGLEMPPDGNRLSPVEIARLERWVERGAPWPQTDRQALRRAQAQAEEADMAVARQKLWSLRPIGNPPLPAVSGTAWPHNPIDRFVLAQLERRGLRPSPPAGKAALLRRLSFDLIGLPPTPEDLDDFLRDEHPQATARVVERLLASPAYGQRWGRHWLDVARYADTKGYVLFQDSNFPWSYTYRDYVVRSFNEDLPFDRFVLEQLAADQMPLGEDRRALAALGFLTLGNGFMNNQQDVIDDRIDVVTRGLLGLTVSCARCHDHKFDPIPTADYYSLYGVFASSVEPLVGPLIEPEPTTEAYRRFAGELAGRQQKLEAFVLSKYRELVDGARTRAAEYLLAAQAVIDSPTTEDFMLLADGADLNPTMTQRYQLFLQRTRRNHDPVMAIWHALAVLPPGEFSQRSADVLRAVVELAAPERPVNALVAAAFAGQRLDELADAARLYGELLAGTTRLWQAAAARQSTGFAAGGSLDGDLAELAAVLEGPEAPASFPRHEVSDLALLPDRPAQGIRNGLVTAIEKFRASDSAAPPRAMALEDLPVPVRPRVFLRGNPNNLGDEVPRRFLRLLSGPAAPASEHSSGRLEVARAIVAGDNPLLARVLVNRVWLAHFGTPLVSTPSDFGMRSTAPAHGELLDWLAWNFRSHGWSLKWLHRAIVHSATYQQAGDDRADCRQIDPENVWLWKFDRRRLDFESTRDALLAVAGQLDVSLGGPPVRDVLAPSATRRTIYGYVDRLNLPGLFRTFDFPNPDASSPQRTSTTVPQQALFFMNGAVVQRAAGGLAARADVAALPDAAAKVTRMVRLALGRDPSTDELAWAARFFEQTGQGPEAWQQFAQSLLLSNEFVFVD